MKKQRVAKIRNMALTKGIYFANPIIWAVIILIYLSAPANLLAHKSRDTKPVHQHIVKEAVKIWPYLSDNLSAINEFRTYLERLDNQDSDPDQDGDPYDGDDIVEGAQEQDKGEVIDRIQFDLQQLNFNYFYTHFWNPDIEPDRGYEEGYISAVKLAKRYWYGHGTFKGLIDEYKAGNKARAYYLLGRVAHLLADMSVPAHVHNDGHIPWEWWTGGLQTDSYEEYVGCNYSAYSFIDVEWLPAKVTLQEIFYELAQTTQWVASDNSENGNDYYLNENGEREPLNYSIWADWDPLWQDDANICDESECGSGNEVLLGNVASRLMPLAFGYTAALFHLFWEETNGYHATGAGPGDLNVDCRVDEADEDIVGASIGLYCNEAGFDPRADTNKDCWIGPEDWEVVTQKMGTTCVPGDANGDCKVNILDLVLVATNFGKASGEFDPRADRNGDGSVSIWDLINVAQNFGQSCPSVFPNGCECK